MLLALPVWAIDMKQPSVKPQYGQNWTWPRKTWLQKRLDIIRAREREVERKPADNSRNPTTVEADPTDEEKPEEG